MQVVKVQEYRRMVGNASSVGTRVLTLKCGHVIKQPIAAQVPASVACLACEVRHG